MNFASSLLAIMAAAIAGVTDAAATLGRQREPRFLFNLNSSGTYVPVKNRTSIAYSTGVATVIGLGMLSVLNTYIEKATALEARHSSLCLNLG